MSKMVSPRSAMPPTTGGDKDDPAAAPPSLTGSPGLTFAAPISTATHSAAISRVTQVNAIAGLTRKFTPNFLVGVLGGYEHFDYSSQAFNGVLKGDGWTTGAYLGWRLRRTGASMPAAPGRNSASTMRPARPRAILPAIAGSPPSA